MSFFLSVFRTQDTKKNQGFILHGKERTCL